jgi:hypothetical protein
MAHLQAPIAVAFLMLLVSPICFASGRALLNDIVRGHASDLAYLLLGLATAALVALWARLALMHEEMPEYARTAGPGFRLRVRMTGDPGFRRENAAGTAPIESWVRHAERLDKIPNVAAARFWQRIQHWRLVIGLGRMPIFVAVLLGLWCYILPILANGSHDRGSRTILPIVMSVLVPGMVVGGVWPRRWYVLADESLRPASRRQFVREQGAAMALEMAITWLWLTTAFFAGALLLEPSTMLSSPLWPALPLIISAQILNFAVIVWVMRFRSGWLVVLPMLLGLLVDGVVLATGGALAEHDENGHMLIAALIFAAAGVAITYHAYRRWLTTEFD